MPVASDEEKKTKYERKYWRALFILNFFTYGFSENTQNEASFAWWICTIFPTLFKVCQFRTYPVAFGGRNNFLVCIEHRISTSGFLKSLSVILLQCFWIFKIRWYSVVDEIDWKLFYICFIFSLKQFVVDELNATTGCWAVQFYLHSSYG